MLAVNKITNIIIPSTVVREEDGETYTVTSIGSDFGKRTLIDGRNGGLR